MDKEQITKILSKIKDTVGENNYKLALAITGHRTGKIKEIIMCSKDGELLLEYVEQLEQQCKKQKKVIDKSIDFIKNGDLLYLANKNSIVYRNNIEIRAVADRLNDLLQILEDKEVSE